MDKLIFPPSGGVFLNPEDIEFEQAAYREALEAILRPIAQNNNGKMIVWGCDVTTTGTVDTISAGYVLINYELRYFSGGSISNILPYSIVAEDTFDPAGMENLANGGTYNTYQRRRAVLETLNLEGVLVLPDFRYANMLRYLLDSSSTVATEIVSIEPASGWLQPPTADKLRVEKKGKMVTLWGNLIPGNLSAITFTHITTLGSYYRPVKRQYHIVPMIHNGSVIIDLNTDGMVYVINHVGTIAENQARIFHVPEIKYEAQ